VEGAEEERDFFESSDDEDGGCPKVVQGKQVRPRGKVLNKDGNIVARKDTTTNRNTQAAVARKQLAGKDTTSSKPTPKGPKSCKFPYKKGQRALMEIWKLSERN
jgi:hypothetical protein